MKKLLLFNILISLTVYGAAQEKESYGDFLRRRIAEEEQKERSVKQKLDNIQDPLDRACYIESLRNINDTLMIYKSELEKHNKSGIFKRIFCSK